MVVVETSKMVAQTGPQVARPVQLEEDEGRVVCMIRWISVSQRD